MKKQKRKSTYHFDFESFTHSLLNKEVEVITRDGTYVGTLTEVGSDIIVLRTRVRGQLVRLAIRIALIIAIFRVRMGPRGPFWGPGPGEAFESSSELGEDRELN